MESYTNSDVFFLHTCFIMERMLEARCTLKILSLVRYPISQIKTFLIAGLRIIPLSLSLQINDHPYFLLIPVSAIVFFC